MIKEKQFEYAQCGPRTTMCKYCHFAFPQQPKYESMENLWLIKKKSSFSPATLILHTVSIGTVPGGDKGLLGGGGCNIY